MNLGNLILFLKYKLTACTMCNFPALTQKFLLMSVVDVDNHVTISGRGFMLHSGNVYEKS